MIDLANNQARHVALLYRQLLKLLDRELAPLGLGPGRYAYLFALYIEDGRSQQALAAAIGADKAAAARSLVRLERDGYVQRVRDTRDRRQTNAFLTQRGKQLRPILEQAATRAISMLTKPLRADERREFQRILAKLAGSLPDPAR